MSLYVLGKEVPNPCTAIRLFALCEAMKWAHLPVAGGLYDQSPDLLEKFWYIFQEKGKQQERERKKQEAEAAKAKRQAPRKASRGRY